MVTCFTWMAHRLASSKSPTKYASAASCRVKMVCTWKSISYHPTSMVISRNRCEKGNIWIRRSVLFWNWQILWRATIPGSYLGDFFTLPAFRNSFQGAMPPVVGLSFLLTTSSPPDIDGLASAATRDNCRVGDDSGNLPTSPYFSASALLLFISLGVGGPPPQVLGVLLALGILIQHVLPP